MQNAARAADMKRHNWFKLICLLYCSVHSQYCYFFHNSGTTEHLNNKPDAFKHDTQEVHLDLTHSHNEVKL